MPEILFPEYRAYVTSRVEVNNAMMALLAGSRLAAHTLSLTVGSTATLSQVFPAVEHIGRFDLHRIRNPTLYPAQLPGRGIGTYIGLNIGITSVNV